MDIIVFSPHQDDEAFSCAGTIVNHVRSGDAATIVFMTDGRLGFNSAIVKKFTQDELAARRHDEALAAAKEMGVPERGVRFLGYKDQDLGNPSHHDEAIAKVRALLDETQPGVVYIAITNYGHVDHMATYFIVFEALERARYAGEVRVSIPVAFVGKPRPPSGDLSRRFARVNEAFPAAKEIKVDVASSMEQKLAAIKAHASQMGMFANLVDPADDFDTVTEEIFNDVYRDKTEAFESRRLAHLERDGKVGE
ncbi:MAG: PIG-L family deacetylase [Candidatus Lokiarchaeota archaeon]|nr:PIG-L family deacetylase [Candidatus Lokiarchaeota archaeon]